MTTFDPFADDVETTETKTEDTKETKTVTASAENSKLTVTLKGGAGFDSPWIVLYADDVADALSQMQDENLKALMDVVKRAGAHFSGGGGNAPQARPQRPQQASGSTPPQQQAPGGESRQCAHGEMVFRSGVSQKNGKPWKGFFCPTPKGTPDQCQAEFIR